MKLLVVVTVGMLTVAMVRGETLRMADAAGTTGSDRLFWVRTMERIADPVVTHLAANTLVGTLRERPGAATNPYRHLECVGRTFNGILPFMNLPDDDTYEGRLRARWRPLILRGIANAVTPGSHDLLEWKKHGQPLVDSAFFAQGLLRAPKIWDALPDEVKANVVARLRETRTTDGYENNWELFGGTIEAFFLAHGYPVDEKRLLRGLDHFCPAKGDPSGNGWYAGDGLYGDGKDFHLDYYNSYVIQPMMATVLDVVLASGKYPQYAERRARIQERFRRYADIQERLIAPDGTYPLVGRSITYRFGAFHHLATSYTRGGDWQGRARPGAVRAALTAVLKRQSGDSNFTSDGWLTVGWNGEQVSLADNYISPGSVYLCTFVFQPLSLSPTAAFWTDPASDWTQKAAWSGKSVPADHAMPVDSERGFDDLSDSGVVTGRLATVGRGYRRTDRRFAGIPSVAVSPKNGRLWRTYYAGPTDGEDSNNYVVLSTRTGTDDWKDVLCFDPDGDGPVRAFDPEIWIAPDGKLHWTWTERKVALRSEGVRWTSGEWMTPGEHLRGVTLDAENPPAAPYPAPRTLVQAGGVMMAKPIVARDGSWLYPLAFWNDDFSARIYRSTDGGKTLLPVGGATLPVRNREFDEHNVVELKDGTLRVYMRAKGNGPWNAWQADSHDGGRTWDAAKPCPFPHPNARFFVRRLASGALLLVKNGSFVPPTASDDAYGNREDMTAFVSDDDGATWKGGLLLHKGSCAYPDGDQAPDGTIYVTFDGDRFKKQEIFHVSFTEADVRRGSR